MAKSPRGPRERTVARTDDAGIRQLIAEARRDAGFFHDLVFNTEKAIGALNYLSRREKAAILAVDPDRLVAGLAGDILEYCGISCGGSCGSTCGAASCGASCGSSCGSSCGGSCGATCGGSCGDSCSNSCADSCVVSCVVSGGLPSREEWAVLPPEIRGNEIARQVTAHVGAPAFSRFQR